MTFMKAQIVEREKQLNQIPALLASLMDGKGAIVAIMGEPGIRKTRLTQEIINIASEYRCKTLIGRSYSVGSDTVYAPIIEMINQNFRGVEPGN